MLLYTPICLYFLCIVWFSIIGDRPFSASDKCTQKYAHCIVLCGLRTSDLYNMRARMYKCLTNIAMVKFRNTPVIFKHMLK